MVLECLPYQHQESNPGKITYSFVINKQYQCRKQTILLVASWLPRGLTIQSNYEILHHCHGLVPILLLCRRHRQGLNNYCKDETNWQQWYELLAKHPQDDAIHALYATRRGLCSMVESSQIETWTGRPESSSECEIC